MSGIEYGLPGLPLSRADLQALIGIPFQRFYPGYYYSSNNFGAGASAGSLQRMTAAPLLVGVATVFDRIGCNVTVGVASSVYRLGIYADDKGRPGALLRDAGTVDTATSGWKEIAFSQALSPGLYWLAGVPQVGTATVTFPESPIPALGSLAGGSPNIIAYYQDSVSAGLPTRFLINGTWNVGVRVMLRAA